MNSISDEQLRAYFLGELPEPEAETLAIECASDTELTERAQAVERELTDEYLRGSLSAAERRLYETNYLITEARRRKFQLAAQLWKIVSESTPPRSHPVASQTPFWKSLFSRRRAFRLAFGSLFLLLAVGGVAFYLLSAKVSRTDVAAVNDPVASPKIEPPAAPSADPTVEKSPKNDRSAPALDDSKSASNDSRKNRLSPERETISPPKNPPPKTIPAPPAGESRKTALAMVFKLLPGSVRGDEQEQSIKIAPETKNLTLLLSPAGEPNNYKIYRAIVKNPEGGTVYASAPLASLSFTMPAAKLENGTYIISLEGKNSQNEFESIADYTFRARR
ncbi:MAG TPA: hypothetical protein VIL74_14925 [Pyrinomonadaceae bacterium]|jgi:hypothetical protein